jgi:hypothetical protein
MEKNHLEWSCEKWSIAWSQRRKEYPAYDKKKVGNKIGHILLRNCLLKHAIEGTIEGRREITGKTKKKT